MRWVERLRPRTIESYVGLYMAVFSMATQITLILLIKAGLGELVLVILGVLTSWLLAQVGIAHTRVHQRNFPTLNQRHSLFCTSLTSSKEGY